MTTHGDRNFGGIAEGGQVREVLRALSRCQSKILPSLKYLADCGLRFLAISYRSLAKPRPAAGNLSRQTNQVPTADEADKDGRCARRPRRRSR